MQTDSIIGDELDSFNIAKQVVCDAENILNNMCNSVKSLNIFLKMFAVLTVICQIY